MTIIQSRVDELLNGGFIARGAHEADSGQRCIQEWCAYMAGEPHSWMPSCVSPVLSEYTIRLNDRLPDEPRQELAQYGPRMLGTAGDGLDDARREIARQALVTDLLPAWLRLAGMDAEADALAAVPLDGLRSHLAHLRDAAWGRREAALESIREKVRAKLAERSAAAAAAADAAADADAAAADPWGPGCDAVYAAARPIFDRAIAESTAPRMVAIRELAEAQRTVALDVLERMIKPEVTQ